MADRSPWHRMIASRHVEQVEARGLALEEPKASQAVRSKGVPACRR